LRKIKDATIYHVHSAKLISVGCVLELGEITGRVQEGITNAISTKRKRKRTQSLQRKKSRETKRSMI
jgi:hypothetical protein